MSKSNYVMAEDPTIDLAVLEAETVDLEEYIVKDDLYRTVQVQTPAGTQMVQMSGGDLLARINRLAAERDQLTPDLQARFDSTRQQAERMIYSLQTRFHQLLNREVKARLDSLNWFLDDSASDPRRARSEYPFEIRNRQRIEVILQELKGDLSPELKQALNRVDNRLRLMVRPSGFIWDPRLEAIYPRERYWYLYASP